MKNFFLGISLVLLLCFVGFALGGVVYAQQSGNEPTYTGFYSVKIKDSIALEEGQLVVARFGGKVVDVLPLSRVIVVDIDKDTIPILKQHTHVDWVEKQALVSLTEVLPHPAISFSVVAQTGSPGEPVDIFIIDSGAGKGITYSSVGAVEDTDTSDRTGHGIDVARTIINSPDLPAGTRIHSIKAGVGNETTASRDNIAEGVRQAIAGGAEIINISYRGTGEPSKSYVEAINAAQEAGVIVVVSAGNDAGANGQNDLTRHPYVISVGALGDDGKPASYTDGLTTEDKADVFTPGTIVSADSTKAQGTSFAAPRVAAAIAKVMQEPIDSRFDTDGDGKWDKDEIRKRIDQGIKDGEFATFRDSDDFVAGGDRTGTAVGVATPSPTPTPSTPVVPIDGGTPTPSPIKAPIPSPIGNTPAKAQALVQCGNAGQPECDLCQLAKLAERVINFIVQISFVISALLFAVAGFFYFTAGGDSGKVTTARKILTDTVVGILIILTAWLVVNVLLTTLVGEGLNPFTSILC